MAPTSVSSEAKALARPRRRLAVLVLALLLVSLAGIVGINGWLGSASLAELINRHSEHLLVEWSKATMIWPGRVFVSDLRIRGQNRHLQWELEVERVRLSISLLALRHQTFRASAVEGEGLRFRMRRRLAEEVDFSQTTGFPPIDGLEIATVGPPLSGPRKEPGWRIELEGIDLANTREIWFDEYRVLGEGRVRGDFQIQIRGTLQADDLGLDWDGGAITIDGASVADALSFESRFQLDPIEAHHLRPEAALRAMTASIDLEGELASLSFLEYYLHSAGVRLSGTGKLSSKTTIERGKPLPGSRMEIVAGSLGARLPRFAVKGNGVITAEVVRRPSGSTMARLRTVFDEVHVESSQAEGSPIATSELHLVVEAPDPDLVAGFAGAEAFLELPDLYLKDLTAFNPLIPEGLGLSIDSGSAHVRSLIDITRAKGKGDLSVSAPDVVLDLSGKKLRGDLRVDLHYQGLLESSTISIERSRLHFDAHAVEDDRGASRYPAWSLDLEIADGRFEFDDSTPGRGHLGRWHHLRPADERLVLEGSLSDLGGLTPYLPQGEWLQLEGQVTVKVDLDVVDRAVQSGSTLTATSDDLRATFAGWTVGGAARIAGLISADAQPHSELSVELEDVEVSRGGSSLLTAPSFHLRAEGEDLSGQSGLRGLDITIELPDAQTADLGWINDYLPHRDLLSLSGEAELEAFAELSRLESRGPDSTRGRLNRPQRRRQLAAERPAPRDRVGLKEPG